MENIFINSLYPKKAKYDFIVTTIGLKVEDFQEFINEHKDWAMNENKGWLSIDILRTKSDPDKYYCKMTKYANGGYERTEEITSKSHMPDRDSVVASAPKLNGDMANQFNESFDNDDLPF